MCSDTVYSMSFAGPGLFMPYMTVFIAQLEHLLWCWWNLGPVTFKCRFPTWIKIWPVQNDHKIVTNIVTTVGESWNSYPPQFWRWLWGVFFLSDRFPVKRGLKIRFLFSCWLSEEDHSCFQLLAVKRTVQKSFPNVIWWPLQSMGLLACTAEVLPHSSNGTPSCRLWAVGLHFVFSVCLTWTCNCMQLSS